MGELRAALSRLFTILAAGLLAMTVLTTQEPATAKCDDIPMAVVGPMTGDWAYDGEEMRRGAQLAVDDINAKGGIRGCKIALTVLDDQYTPATAIALAKKLAKDGVRFVIGHFNSGNSVPAAMIYAKNNTLMISPASTNPGLTELNFWNVLRTAGRDDIQGAFAGEYMADHFQEKNLAIISDGTPYGDGLANKARKTLRARAHPEKLAKKIKFGQGDFSDLVNQLKLMRIEVLFSAGLANDFGPLIRQTKEAGLNVQFISGDGALVHDLPGKAGPALEGVLIAFSLDDRGNPAAADVVARFRSQGFEPADYTLKSYAAVQVAAKGIEIAGSQAPRAVVASIKSGQPIPTVLGNLTFDAKGDRIQRDVTMYVWKKRPDGTLTMDFKSP